jgi:hypothetical protein
VIIDPNLYDAGKCYNVDVLSMIGGDVFVGRVGWFQPRVRTIDAVYAILQKIWNKVAQIGVAAWANFSARGIGPLKITIGDAYNATTGNRIVFSFVGLNSIENKTITGQLRKKNGDKIADLAGSVKTFSADPADTQEAYVDINFANYSDLWTPSRETSEHELLCQVEYGANNRQTPGRADVVLLRG